MTTLRDRAPWQADGDVRRAEAEALRDAAERQAIPAAPTPERPTAGWHDTVGDLTEAALAGPVPEPAAPSELESATTRLDLDELGTITISVVRRDGVDRLVIEARADVLRGLERELPALLASLRSAGAPVTAVALLARTDAGTALARSRTPGAQRAPAAPTTADQGGRLPRRRRLELEG